MTMAISKAVEHGAKAVICASTGNTSASAAAYAAHAGITAAVLVPEGKIAMGKLSQAIAHNAQLLQVQGNFDDCLDIARDLAANYPVHLVNSVNNDRIEGQKTAAFEVVEVLGDAPDFHFVPVGNAGNYTAYPRGYSEELERGATTKLPRMFGFQAAGSAPIVRGRRRQAPRDDRQRDPHRQPRLVGARPRGARATATATSARSPTRRSSRPTASSRPRSASSSSPRRRSASRACSSAPRPAQIPQGRHRRAHGHRPRPERPAVGPQHRRRRRRHARPSSPSTPPRSPSVLGLARAVCMTRPLARGRSVTGQGARHLGEPRPGLRHARARARALRRARPSRSRDEPGRRRRGHRRRRGRGAHRRDRTSSCARSPHAFDALRPAPARAATSSRRNVDPARPRPRLVRRRDRLGHHGGQGPARGHRRDRLDRAARPRHRARGPPRQRRARRCSAASRSPGRTADGPQHKKLIVHRGVSPLVFVPEATMSTAARPQPAARLRAARGRHLQRVALGAARSRRSSRAPSCCSPRPRTVCTRATAPARCPRPTPLIRLLRDARARRRRLGRRALAPRARQRPRPAPRSPPNWSREHAATPWQSLMLAVDLQRCYSGAAPGRSCWL